MLGNRCDTFLHTYFIWQRPVNNMFLLFCCRTGSLGRPPWNRFVQSKHTHIIYIYCRERESLGHFNAFYKTSYAQPTRTRTWTLHLARARVPENVHNTVAPKLYPQRHLTSMIIGETPFVFVVLISSKVSNTYLFLQAPYPRRCLTRMIIAETSFVFVVLLSPKVSKRYDYS